MALSAILQILSYFGVAHEVAVAVAAVGQRAVDVGHG
jgi:hypothetical protein